MSMRPRPGSEVRTVVRSIDPDGVRSRTDAVATEEPMEIRLASGDETRTVAVTMRTPGRDFELAAGFLYAEGVISSADDLQRITYCTAPDLDADQRYNVVTVTLRSRSLPDLERLERHFTTTSACGICGKASIDALHTRGCAVLPEGPEVPADVLRGLPEKLRDAQQVFESTGGLHASALFDPSGEAVCVREDVGRHNALDKLVGWALTSGRLPLHDHAVLVSGRASYELVQKCVVAGVPVLCAVSAPSSLAVELARDFGMTLVGFLRGDRFNVYAGAERIV